MRFHTTKLKGACIVELDELSDERGFFARAWCRKEFEAQGLNPGIVQANVSFNNTKGTLRGMHYQTPPHAETKLIRCTRGALYDVIVDLRPESETYKDWVSVELSVENHRMLYVPEGFAHGFQTLEDSTEVFYLVSEFYTPDAAKGLRYDDPAFRIEWPLYVSVVSQKDRSWPDYTG